MDCFLVRPTLDPQCAVMEDLDDGKRALKRCVQFPFVVTGVQLYQYLLANGILVWDAASILAGRVTNCGSCPCSPNPVPVHMYLRRRDHVTVERHLSRGQLYCCVDCRSYRPGDCLEHPLHFQEPVIPSERRAGPQHVGHG